MACRPVFIPIPEFPYVKKIEIEFDWYPGFSISQAQKSIRSLHIQAKKRGLGRILDISTKSTISLGVKLSAFNLLITPNNFRQITVECAFQGSKVFTQGGPFHDIYEKTSREAKKDERIKNSGALIGFNYFGEIFPTNPLTCFYDWLYMQALFQNERLSIFLDRYKGFSDIAFNPEKSINCQARAAALFVSFNKYLDLPRIVGDKNYYSSLISDNENEALKSDFDGNQLGLQL